jgi:ergothioneine biosynthesis protein EgtB
MTSKELNFFTTTREETEKLCDPLFEEDYNLQAMAEVSPTKWHLAHTTWFFERFLLAPHSPGYKEFRPEFNFLYNSYYDSVGNRVDRDKRGLLSRPRLSEVRSYRAYVTEAVQRLERPSQEMTSILTLGIHHEQQHQELMLTDIKYNLYSNPIRPAYYQERPIVKSSEEPAKWLNFGGGLQEIGAFSSEGFTFDNENPRHRVYLEDYKISSKQVSNLEYLEFIQDGGYQNPLLWLSDGWAQVQKQNWRYPLYWEKKDDSFFQYTLGGLRKLDLNETVSHISLYEADAYARWKGARLPTEEEWENAAVKSPGDFFKDRWDWTASAYLPYPGFKPLENAFGEYNAKFMSNQMVLRGGSHATPRSHIRPTYRNFFPPETRWQFTSLRLAQN